MASKFKKWWEKNFSLKKAVERSLEGTNFEGSSFGSLLANFFGSWASKVSGSSMTTAQKQEMDSQLANQQILNQEEYDRKIDFYERFESPQARVRQYKEAGLNPMLLAGNGASVSASGGVGSPGSASMAPSADSSGFPDVLGSILGVMRFGLQSKDTKSQIREREQKTTAQRIENQYIAKMHDIEIKQKEADINRTNAEIDQIRANIPLVLANTDYARTMALYAPEYFEATIGKERSEALRNESQVRLNDKEIENLNAVIKVHQKEISEIDAKIALMSSEVALNAAKKDLTEQEVRESQERVKKMEKEIEKIGVDIGLTNKDIQYYIWNHPRSSSAFGLRWNNSSSSGTQRDKLSPEITDDELLMYVRERFGFDAAESLKRQ